MYVLNREFYGDHHHLPAAVPVNDWPEMQAIQYMPRNVWFSIVSSFRVGPHFVVRVYKPYGRVSVDGFTCSQEVDNLADGPVDQLSLNEILEFSLHQSLFSW